MCESDSCILQFLNELNLTYRRLSGFVASFYSFQQCWCLEVGFHCVTLLSDLFQLLGSDLDLDSGLRDHVITRFASVGIRARLRNKVISFCYFCFFSVPFKFFSVCLHFLFFVYASSKQKKKGLYFILLLSVIISETNHGHATHTQRHQFLESQVNQV